jgi:hypothetical protein
LNRRVRRVLYILTAGALASRLYVLGEQRGFGLVAGTTLRITALALGAWLVHLVLHELALLVAALSQGFRVRGVALGPAVVNVAPGRRLTVSARLSLGGGVNSLPRGVAGLSRRLRLVAAAGPAVTLLVTALAWWAWSGRGESLASPLGVFVAMGALTFVTAMLPAVLLPSPPDSGTDLEQLVQPRPVFAHWVNAAAVQQLAEGGRLADALDHRAWQHLLPPATSGHEVEVFELGWALAALDAGEPAAARERLRSMVERFDEHTPQWLRLDTLNQLGCLAALEGDVPLAQSCLGHVRELQHWEWYAELLEACLQRARGEDFYAALHRWRAGVATHPVMNVALAGNRWILGAIDR